MSCLVRRISSCTKKFLSPCGFASSRTLGNDSADVPDPSTVEVSHLLQEELIEGFSRKPQTDPSGTNILLFPGQGSQYVGMTSDLLQYPNVKQMFEVASEILHFDLLDYCQHGPQTELDRTVHCQPAVMVTSLAGVEKIQVIEPSVLESCVACAGYSVGEFAALVFSGVLSFEDAISLVGTRSRAMQRASDVIPSRMVTAIGGAKTRFNFACEQSRDYCREELAIESPVCRVAAHLSPNTVTLAGHDAAISYIEEHARDFYIKRIKPINVSGAFHTPLMTPAAHDLRNALQRVEVSPPLVHVYSNLTGKRYSGPEQIRSNLPDQIVNAVKWEQIIHNLVARPPNCGMPGIYDVGPGRQFSTLLKQSNGKAAKNYVSVAGLQG